jgi:O-antigen ligase
MSETASERLPDSSPAGGSAIVRAAAAYYFLTLVFQGKIATVELGAFLIIFCTGWAIARRELRFSAHILYLPLLLYGIVSTVSALSAGRRIHAYGEAMLWFKMLIFPAALILLRSLPQLRRFAVYGHAVFAFYVSAWGLAEFFLLDRRDLEHRINGPTTHVMTFSGLILPLSLLLLLHWWHQRKPWQLVLAGMSTLALLLTFTRSVWLGWLAAVAVVMLASRARLAFYALPALILFVTFLPLSLFSRLVSTFDLQQSSNFDRIRMVEAGAEMIKDFPLLGVGPGNVKEVYALYRRQDAPRPRPPHLHNNAVQLWAERGVLGLGAYLMLLGLFLRECIRGWRSGRKMWAEIGVAVAVSLTVAGLFEFNFGDTEVFYILLNLMALVVASLEPGPNEPVMPVVPANG